MKKINWLGTICAGLALIASSAQAVCPRTYIDLDLGYRWDHLFHQTVGYTEGTGAAATNPVRFSHVNSFVIGGRGQWNMGCSNFFIRGAGHYGWMRDADYFEASFIARNPHGHISDAYATVGYLFSCHPCFGLGPVVGYNWEEFKFNTNHYLQSVAGPVVTYVDRGPFRSKQTFKGPLVGLELLFQPSRCYEIDLEWDLIIGRWEYTDKLALLSARNSKRNHPLVWGNRFHIDTTFFPFPCWRIGLDLAYETRNGQGTGKFRRTVVPLAFAQQRVADFSWQSFTAMFHTGFNF